MFVLHCFHTRRSFLEPVHWLANEEKKLVVKINKNWPVVQLEFTKGRRRKDRYFSGTWRIVYWRDWCLESMIILSRGLPAALLPPRPDMSPVNMARAAGQWARASPRQASRAADSPNSPFALCHVLCISDISEWNRSFFPYSNCQRKNI